MFPLFVDYNLLTRLTTAELRGPGREPSVLWRSDDGCSVFEIGRIRITPADGLLEIQADGNGRAGLGVLSWCLFPVERDADLRIRARPVFGDDWQLRLTDVEVTVLDRKGRSTFLMRRLTGAVGEPIEDSVARVKVDLAPPAAEMRDMIRSSLGPEHAERALAALDSLRPAGATATASGVKAEVTMRVSPGPPRLVGPEPPLTEDERQRWEDALADWDAFLTFMVKELGVSEDDPNAVDALFRLFTSGRYGIVAVLAAGPSGEDPVRTLFLDAWSQIRDIVRRLAAQRDGPAGSRSALLCAFSPLATRSPRSSTSGPDVGVVISADGLRRLARALDPRSLFDPHDRSEAPDPALRKLFGFHEPPSTPLPPEPPARRPQRPTTPRHPHRRRHRLPHPLRLPRLRPQPSRRSIADYSRVGGRGRRWRTRPTFRTTRSYARSGCGSTAGFLSPRRWTPTAPSFRACSTSWRLPTGRVRHSHHVPHALSPAGARHRLAGELLAPIRPRRWPHRPARLVHGRHRAHAGEPARLARRVRRAAARAGCRVQRRCRHADPRAVSRALRGAGDRRDHGPRRAGDLCGLQRRTGRVYTLPHRPRGVGVHAHRRYCLLEEVPGDGGRPRARPRPVPAAGPLTPRRRSERLREIDAEHLRQAGSGRQRQHRLAARLRDSASAS